MPTYEYIDERTEQRVELTVPIARRDSIPGLRRVFAAPQVAAIGLATDPNDLGAQTRQSLKDMEHRYGAERIAKESGYSVETLKRVWKE